MHTIEASKVLIEKLHEAGNVNDLKLTEEHLNYETLRLEVLSDEDELIQKREALNVLLGLDSEHRIWKISKGTLKPEIKVIENKEAESKAITNSLDLALSRQRVTTLISELGLEEDFALLQESELGAKGAKEPSDDWEFGPKFKVPIPIFNTGSARIYRSNTELSQQYDFHADLEVKIKSSARSLTQRLKISAEKLKAFETSLNQLHEKLVSESQKHYNAMLIGADVLLQAKLKQINARKEYIKLLMNFNLLKAKLDSLLSGNLIEA